MIDYTASRSILEVLHTYYMNVPCRSTFQALPLIYAPQKVGACGGYGGEEKDMRVAATDLIRIIRVHVYIQGDNEAIKALTIEFERNGRRESTRLWADRVWKKQQNRPSDEVLFFFPPSP
jgi:hypothetical protein